MVMLTRIMVMITRVMVMLAGMVAVLMVGMVAGLVMSLVVVVQGIQVIRMMIVIMKWKYLGARDQGKNQL